MSAKNLDYGCLSGWSAVMEGHYTQGIWKDHHLSWHMNRLEMLTVFFALRHFLVDLRSHHVLIRTDNMLVVSYIKCQGGLKSCPLSRLTHQILVWSQDKFLSVRSLYIPGVGNVGADILSRQGLRLHPEVVELIWTEFG